MKVVLEKVSVFQKPQRREVIVFGITLLGFLFVFFKSCWFPSTDAIALVQKETQELLERQNQIAKTNQDTKRKTSEDLPANTAAAYTLWANQFVKSPDVLLMKEFSNPAIIKDLRIKNIEFADSKQDGDLTIQGFKLAVEGSFVSLRSYLNKLENLPIIFITRNITINVTNEDLGRINAELQGEAYGWE
ncbi:MAG: hypothetical protein ACD_62C00440G0002 [uncultured bacterium]|nr:MAG: hypothetical protein ACD_62C00440G0002 [uncultured bacterium]